MSSHEKPQNHPGTKLLVQIPDSKPPIPNTNSITTETLENRSKSRARRPPNLIAGETPWIN